MTAAISLAVVVAAAAAGLWVWSDRGGRLPSPFGGSTQSPDESTFVSALAFDAAGSILAVGTQSGLVTLWNTSDGRPLTSLRPRVTRIDSLAVSEGGAYVAMGFTLGIVAIWDERQRSEVAIISVAPDMAAQPPGNPLCLSFQYGNQVVLGYDGTDHALRFFELASRTQYAPLQFEPRSDASASLSPDQRFLALGDATSGRVQVFDLLTRTSLGTVSGGGGKVHATAVSPDGRRVAAAQAYSLFYLWDVATGQSVSMFDGPAPVSALAYSPNGRWLASGGQGTVILWDTSTFREVRRLDLKSAPPAS